MKSTTDEIRTRFDTEVERFSNLDTGQAATMDARLCMEVVSQAAAATTPAARDLLDIGCGAGNYTLMMLAALQSPAALAKPQINCTLVDLSRPMLDRARERVANATAGNVTTLQGDMRELALGDRRFDIVLAASTLHHLRADDEWDALFANIHRALRPGGSFWIFDLIEQASPALQKLMWFRYGDFLANLKGGGPAGAAYRDEVFAYIAHEDTPRPLMFQIDRLRHAGFAEADILHKNGPFAAFGARRPPI